MRFKNEAEIDMKALLIGLTLVTVACSHTQPFTRARVVNPQPAAIEQRIIFVGDAGKATPGDAVWAKLDRYLTKDALVVFLGDNVYEYGLPDASENDGSYELYAARLSAQINAAKKARKTIFIPGNHDWNSSRSNGRKRILAQQRFVTERGAHFAPQNGCAGIAAEPVGKGSVMLFIDSQAVIDLPDDEAAAAKAPASDCAIKHKRQFESFASDYLQKNIKPGTRIILAAHHPLVSEGSHGGFFDWPHHIFPVYNYNKYFPLPVVASLVVFTRQWGWITSTDISHSKYRKYLNSIATILKNREVFLYAAGHDHNLQLFSGTGPVKYHLISGSGSKRDAVTHNDQTLLAWEKNGFFVVDIYTDASARATAVGDTVEEELVFELR
jgi:hypothetical protein